MWGLSPNPQPRLPTGATLPGSPEANAAAQVRSSTEMSKSHPVYTQERMDGMDGIDGMDAAPAQARSKKGIIIGALVAVAVVGGGAVFDAGRQIQGDGARARTGRRAGAGRGSAPAAPPAAAVVAPAKAPEPAKTGGSQGPGGQARGPGRRATWGDREREAWQQERRQSQRQEQVARACQGGGCQTRVRQAGGGRRPGDRSRQMKQQSAGKRFVHIFGAAALLTVGWAWNAPPARAGDSAEAESLIRQGVELRAQKKDERALPLFEKAYQLSRTPRTAGQLGLVEMALGYFVDAEKYLGEAVASPDHPWVAKNLATLKAQLATAKSQIGELYVIGEPDGAEVLVNGKVLGKLPLSTPIRLDKGRAEVQVRAPGYVATTDMVTMVGGKREDRSYRLQREAVAVAPPPPVPVQPVRARHAETRRVHAAAGDRTTPPPAGDAGAPTASIVTAPAPDQGAEPSSLRPVTWGLGIGAGAALIFGAVEGLIATKKKNEFNDHMGPDPRHVSSGQILRLRHGRPQRRL